MTPYFEINREGHNIRCRLYSTDSHTISSLIVFCHGFGGHKDNRTAEKFAERVLTKYKGIGVVCFDWPAHGEDVKKKLHMMEVMILRAWAFPSGPPVPRVSCEYSSMITTR